MGNFTELILYIYDTSNIEKKILDVFKFDFGIKKIERVAIVGFSARNQDRIEFGHNIQVISIPEFMKQISAVLSEYTPLQKAVPESYNLLRAIQYTVAYGTR